MKILFFISFLLIGCTTINKTNTDFVYQNINKYDTVLVDYDYYDSKTNMYFSKALINDNTLEYKEIKFSMKLSEEKKKELFKLYQSLNISNPNRCIYDKSTGKILAKSIIRFYSNKTKWEDEQCNIDVDNKKFNNLLGEIDKTFVSTPEYKEAFKESFIGK